MKNKFKVLLSVLALSSVMGIAAACGGNNSASGSSGTSDSNVSESVETEEKYTVKFVDDDDTVISETEYEEGATVTVPADPTKAEANGYTYTFAGWDKEVTAVTGDVTYKATYNATPVTYTVTFMADGEQVGEAISYNVESTEIDEPEVPAKEGYTGAWEAYTLDGNVTVNAVYTAIEYTVSFNHPMTGMLVADPITYTIETMGEVVFPEVPEMEGYTGVWSKTEADLAIGGLVVNPVYTANTYKITYDAKGGTMENDVTTQEVTFDEEYELLAPTATPKFYQEFLSWVDENGNSVTAGTWKIASDVTLTAQYSNVITFDSMTEVPSYLQNGGRASLSIVEGNGGKVLQATSENNDQGNVRIMMPLTYLGEFFKDSAVQYMAFDLKLPEGVTASGSSILYQNADQSGWTSYETSQFDTVPTDAYKRYYLPRSAYEAWVANGKTEARILNVQAGVTQGKSYWVDNIRPVTADEYTADLYSFETGSLRTTMSDGPGFCSPSNNQFHLKFTNADPAGAKFTNEIVSDGMRALMFTKYSGITQIMFNQNTETSMEAEMRGAGYVAFDLYVPEGSDAAIVRYGQTWYGTLKQGWNTVYEKVDATYNDLISFTDTTASTYVIDNFRLLTEVEYNAAMCGFETGGVLRDNNSNDDTSHSGWAYYYAGADKANNKCSLGVSEGNGDSDVATLSNVRFATEQVHGGEYSLAFDKKSGYISLHMAADSAMYSLMKNGFTFWIYSTTAIDGASDTQFINGVNGKLNGGKGVTIEANTWTQITVTAEDIHATAGRFLILQGATEGTIYLDDFQPLPAADAE